MSTFQRYRKSLKLSERKEARQDNLWQEYEIWRKNHETNLPKLVFEDVPDLQVRERMQEAILNVLKESDEDPKVRAWRLSLQDANISVLQERKQLFQSKEEWEKMGKQFPYNLIISLLKLEPQK